ncbi:N-acyl homoserine lactonase family protein [Actinomadura madurae]|uniref:N-acyl homoserine lactonase family protein n=1 Tax=Actinomadura madurae TaxID=1993 RepID=UPI00399B0AE9
MNGATYEVTALRYGTRTGTKAEIYLNYAIYGEPDEPLGMDYYCWVARNAARTVVIDTGFGPEGGARRGRTTVVDPVEALARAGVDAATVPQVIVTHAHYDHIGNLARFPAAEVIMARREFEFWTGPYARRAQFAVSAEERETSHLAEVRGQGRMTLIDEPYTVAPGIEVVPVGGHTPGQAIVLVATAGGQAVLASDSVHYYEEIERDRPFTFVADVEAMYRGFDLLNEIVAAPGRVLVPGHDPDVLRRFPVHDGFDPGTAVRIG